MYIYIFLNNGTGSSHAVLLLEIAAVCYRDIKRVPLPKGGSKSEKQKFCRLRHLYIIIITHKLIFQSKE